MKTLRVILTLFVMFMLFFSIHAEPGGTKKMDRIELSSQIKRLRPDDEQGLEKISARILSETRTPLEDVVHIWSLPDKEMSAKAAFLIDEFEELAIDPLLKIDTSNNVKKNIWRITTIVEAELELRTKIAAHLDALLEDVTPVPMPDMGPIEEPPPPRRVCDEAYVRMRQLLNMSESRVQQLMNIDEFLNLPNKEKDSEIAKARKSKKWTEFLEDIEMVEE